VKVPQHSGSPGLVLERGRALEAPPPCRRRSESNQTDADEKLGFGRRRSNLSEAILFPAHPWGTSLESLAGNLISQSDFLRECRYILCYVWSRKALSIMDLPTTSIMVSNRAPEPCRVGSLPRSFNVRRYSS